MRFCTEGLKVEAENVELLKLKAQGDKMLKEFEAKKSAERLENQEGRDRRMRELREAYRIRSERGLLRACVLFRMLVCSAMLL